MASLQLQTPIEAVADASPASPSAVVVHMQPAEGHQSTGEDAAAAVEMTNIHVASGDAAASDRRVADRHHTVAEPDSLAARLAANNNQSSSPKGGAPPHQTTPSHPPTKADSRAWGARHPVGCALLTLLALGILAGIVIIIWQVNVIPGFKAKSGGGGDDDDDRISPGPGVPTVDGEIGGGTNSDGSTGYGSTGGMSSSSSTASGPQLLPLLAQFRNATLDIAEWVEPYSTLTLECVGCTFARSTEFGVDAAAISSGSFVALMMSPTGTASTRRWLVPTSAELPPGAYTIVVRGARTFLSIDRTEVTSDERSVGELKFTLEVRAMTFQPMAALTTAVTSSLRTMQSEPTRVRTRTFDTFASARLEQQKVQGRTLAWNATGDAVMTEADPATLTGNVSWAFASTIDARLAALQTFLAEASDAQIGEQVGLLQVIAHANGGNFTSSVLEPFAALTSPTAAASSFVTLGRTSPADHASRRSLMQSASEIPKDREKRLEYCKQSRAHAFTCYNAANAYYRGVFLRQLELVVNALGAAIVLFTISTLFPAASIAGVAAAAALVVAVCALWDPIVYLLVAPSAIRLLYADPVGTLQREVQTSGAAWQRHVMRTTADHTTTSSLLVALRLEAALAASEIEFALPSPSPPAARFHTEAASGTVSLECGDVARLPRVLGDGYSADATDVTVAKFFEVCRDISSSLPAAIAETILPDGCRQQPPVAKKVPHPVWIDSGVEWSLAPAAASACCTLVKPSESNEVDSQIAQPYRVVCLPREMLPASSACLSSATQTFTLSARSSASGSMQPVSGTSLSFTYSCAGSGSSTGSASTSSTGSNGASSTGGAAGLTGVGGNTGGSGGGETGAYSPEAPRPGRTWVAPCRRSQMCFGPGDEPRCEQYCLNSGDAPKCTFDCFNRGVAPMCGVNCHTASDCSTTLSSQCWPRSPQPMPAWWTDTTPEQQSKSVSDFASSPETYFLWYWLPVQQLGCTKWCHADSDLPSCRSDCITSGRAPQCTSSCVARGDAPLCTRWCYNLGDAPSCLTNCWNESDAPACTSSCYNYGAAGSCTSWCYNSGAAPKCVAECYHGGDAPACEAGCHNAGDAPKCGHDCYNEGDADACRTNCFNSGSAKSCRQLDADDTLIGPKCAADRAAYRPQTPAQINADMQLDTLSPKCRAVRHADACRVLAPPPA